MTRREYLVRAEQAERTLAETRRAREAETHAAALAERARIARDIHDVLAHSLAAVSVNLQAAEGLLAAESLPTDNPELTKAIECIDRAGTLTREGLAQARRAILALREDAAPLPDQLASLAAQYQAAGDATIQLTITGQPRPLSEQAVLVAYRTAQEGLTNARKHAPGQPVALTLAFEPAQVAVTVENPLPPAGEQGPLAATGAGAGLAGLKERAALAGGALGTGPADGTWRIALRMPA
jgi:signal transduction histidine kinase